MSRKDTAWVQRSFFKRSRSGHKESLKIDVTTHKHAVRHMLSWVILHLVIDSDVYLTIGRRQTWLLTEVRRRSGQMKSNFSKRHFCIQKTHVSDSECPQDSKYVIRFLLQCAELPKIGSRKKCRDTFFSIHCYKNVKNRDVFLIFCMCLVAT